tara:strand:+ start:677 stop:1066 length:390 start_codon:yes stop_codon:yes gene_type:complete
MNILINFLLWTWCLPQTLLGLFVFLFYKIRKRHISTERYNNAIMFRVRASFFSGASLGKFVILREYHKLRNIKHEYGHFIQNLFFGPLYLFIIGIPSTLRNLWWRIRSLPVEDYYKGYPEKWADILGKV